MKRGSAKIKGWRLERDSKGRFVTGHSGSRWWRGRSFTPKHIENLRKSHSVYKTEEERKRARRVSVRKYYIKHREQILDKRKEQRRRDNKITGGSEAEEKVYNALLTVFRPEEIIRNSRRVITNPITGRGLELDIYIPSKKLAFEVDGIVHREPKFGEKNFLRQRMRDIIKNIMCRIEVIELIRIPFGRDVGMFGDKAIVRVGYLKKLCQ